MPTSKSVKRRVAVQARADTALAFYTIDADHNVTPATLDEWNEVITDTELRRVGHDRVGENTISTVFLGVDHGGWGLGEQLFETMIFGPEGRKVVARYDTWDNALIGHTAVVAAERDE